MTTIISVIEALAACGIAFALTKISVEDCRTFKIRNALTVTVALIALAYRLALEAETLAEGGWNGPSEMLAPLIAGVIGMLSVALPMLLVNQFFHMPVGGGDIKLMGGLGLFLGWQGSVWVLIVSNIAAILVYAVRKAALKKDVGLKTRIPMGIYIQIGYTAVILWRWASLIF